jgi:hypothetical protein
MRQFRQARSLDKTYPNWSFYVIHISGESERYEMEGLRAESKQPQQREVTVRSKATVTEQEGVSLKHLQKTTNSKGGVLWDGQRE